jgi:DHA2 family multidrug resistance protein
MRFLRLHEAPVSATGIVLHAAPAPRPHLTLDSARTYIGIAGVLIGSIISLVGSRTTTFGLADLRGGLSAGFDEGAWITTSFGVGQMFMGVCSVYLGAVFGVRRVLLLGMTLFFTTCLLGPLSPNLPAFLTMQFLGGIGSGTFIPLTISFILRSLPPRLVVYGIAVYAMNSEMSQNVAASLEGWYTEHWSWHWIDWQYCVLLPVMFVCVWVGMPREGTNFPVCRRLDWPGLAYAAIGFSLLYAGLDQGNRLDWTNSGVVVGLLIAGAISITVFVVREMVTPRPFMNIRLMFRENLPLLLLILAGFRFIILSTAYIIPTYLQTVQNFRELQVGTVLLWIAVPQIVIVLPLAWVLKRTDARWVLALGTTLIGIACLMATNLTSQWATWDFLPSQIVQAIGQSFALTGLLVATIRSISPADAMTIGAMLQISRLFGGELGTAFMQTFVRVREQVHSNLVGLHVETMAGLTTDRLSAYGGAVGSHTSDAAQAAGQATRLLASTVQQQASVLAYIDGFLAAALGAFVMLLLVAWLRRPPPSPF